MGFMRSGGRLAWGLILALVFVLVGSTVLLANTANVRYERDVTRMVFNDNLELLEEVRRTVGAVSDSLESVLSEAPSVPQDRPYLVVSIEERRVWYKQGDRVLFETGVAVGSGKTLVRGSNQWKFDTPRGRLVVQRKDLAPAWVPPDWHFVEQANKRGLGIVRLARGQSVQTADGAEVTVVGSDVVKRTADGSSVPFSAADGREIVVNGNIIVPPFGTNQRKYEGVLGTHRLYLGDGYALHGTNQPSSIGQAVSHGCIRLRNEDIERLYNLVPLGTPVYIY
jgi:hypothetical protein